MAYDVTLVEVISPGGSGGVVATNTLSGMGFPTTPFNFLLMSIWCCLPGSSGPFGGSDFLAALPFGSFTGAPSSSLSFITFVPFSSFFQAHYQTAAANVRSNILLSINCLTQTVQYYVNDAPVSPTSGGWTAHASFGGEDIFANWNLDTFSVLTDYPAVADWYVEAPTQFFDLSIEANRRKFINSDLTPVDLGSDGSLPTGHKPAIFLTVPSGGTPTSFLTNRGRGTNFHLNTGITLDFQTPGTCTLPSIVQVPLTGVSATAQVGAFPQFHELKLVSLYPILPSSGDAYGLISDFGADFPTSFGQFSLSVWCCEDVNIRGPNSYATPFSFDMKFTPTMATLQFYDSLNQALFSGSFTNPHTPTDLYHVMFSIDTQAQTYALWIASGAAAIEWATSDANFATVGGINNVGA